MNKCCYIVFLFLFFQACQTPEVPRPIGHSIDSVAIQYLLFKQEKLLELWTHPKDSCPQLLDSFSLKESIDFPIGIYFIHSEENTSRLSYPNEFYTQKGKTKAFEKHLSFEKWQQAYPRLKEWEPYNKGKRVLVLPNDKRKAGKWKACFACPHWMAEVYSQLELKIRAFPYFGIRSVCPG